MSHYVYTFAYPESMGGQIFYVGKGQFQPNSNDRIRVHLRIAAKTNVKPKYRVYEVIQSIWAAGGKVIIRKPYNHVDHFEALRLERKLIYHYGFEQLVNIPYVKNLEEI